MKPSSPPLPPSRSLPRRTRRWSGRLRTLTTALILAAASVLFTVTPAHADAYVTITDWADPVPVNTSYTYTVAYTGPRHVSDASVTLSGAAATITAVTATRTASSPADPNPANDSDSATCTVISIVLTTCP